MINRSLPIFFKGFIPIILSIPVFFGFLVTGCSYSTNKDIYNSEKFITVPNIQNSEATLILTQPMSTSSPKDNSLEYIPTQTTSGAVSISTIEPKNNNYLYKDAIVIFKNVSLNAKLLLNLDDMTDNNQQRSDFVIYVDTGAEGTTFEIYPTNNASYYFSNSTSMDYYSCIANFPETDNGNNNNNPLPPVSLGSGKPYCILTNEGRMAIIYLVKDSIEPYSQGNFDLKLDVTVYKKVETRLIKPTLTQQSGSLQTNNNRYAVMGLTDNQAKIIDYSIQAFIDAIKIEDKNSINKLIDYPVDAIYSDNVDLPIFNQEYFYKHYEIIFPQEYMIELANATLNDNVKVSSERITLETNNYEIEFSKDGKIRVFIQKFDFPNN